MVNQNNRQNPIFMQILCKPFVVWSTDMAALSVEGKPSIISEDDQHNSNSKQLYPASCIRL